MNPLKALRRIFPKRKHGAVTINNGAAQHSELGAKQRRAAEKKWGATETSFSYVVHPLRKFVEIKRANYGSISKLKEVLAEARALSKRLGLPLGGRLSGTIKSGSAAEPAIVYDVELGRDIFRVTALNLKDSHTLYSDLRVAEEAATMLGMQMAEFSYQIGIIRIGKNPLEKVTELDLPQGWKMTKRAEVGSRGGGSTTYYLYKELPSSTQ